MSVEFADDLFANVELDTGEDGKKTLRFYSTARGRVDLVVSDDVLRSLRTVLQDHFDEPG
jgi:hypothetical protein